VSGLCVIVINGKDLLKTSIYAIGLHFHLAASINAETDIPLVPSLAGGGRFILHWLHNKEMHFTSQAEAILHDLTKKVSTPKFVNFR
jgi:hypothetical protein